MDGWNGWGVVPEVIKGPVVIPEKISRPREPPTFSVKIGKTKEGKEGREGRKERKEGRKEGKGREGKERKEGRNKPSWEINQIIKKKGKISATNHPMVCSGNWEVKV